MCRLVIALIGQRQAGLWRYADRPAIQAALRAWADAGPRDTAEEILDSKLLRAGDVIEVLETGQSAGTEADTNPDWGLLDLPNISVAQAASLLSPEPEDNPQSPNPRRQKRGFRLDLAALAADLGPWVAGQAKASNLGPVQFLARYRVRVVALANPLRL